MAKRANSEGSIFELKDGRWRAQISIGGGKYRTRTVATQADALAALKALNREAEAGVVVAGDLTVADLLEEWRTKDQAASDRTRGTISSNFGHLEAWRRTIGSKRVARLTVADVESAMVAMSKGRKTPYSRETMTKRRSILNLVYKAAIRRGRVRFNPAEHAVLPAGAPRTEARRSFTVEQANTIIRETAPRRNGAAYLLGLSLGLRPGELFGLTWSAVDFRRGTIHVQRSVSMESGRPALRDMLKNEGSLRTLSMPGFVADALRVQFDRMEAEGLESDLVFPDNLGGPMDLGVFRDWFRTTISALGFGDDWTPNEMRHTAASLLSDHGVPRELIADTLGHRTTRMVDKHYRHSHRAEQSGHVAPMEAMLAPRKRSRKTG
jgi:integrase